MTRRPSPPQLSRRFLLKGVGGAALALPILPSLLSATEVAAQSVSNQKNYIHFFTEHGSVWGANMFPSDGAVVERLTLAGHEVRRSILSPATSNGMASLCPVLTAPSSLFTPTLAAKMNVLRGLDIPFGIAHYRGATLGNYASNNGDNPLSAEVRDTQPRRTLDQVMAWAPEFYGAQAGVAQRSVTVAVPDPYADAHLSYGYSNPAAGAGSVAPIQGTLSAWDLFARLFPDTGTTPTQRAPIVDRVLEQYRALRNGHRRLSQADKERLDDYIQRVFELQRRLGTRLASCTEVVRPATNNTQLETKPGFAINPLDHAEYYRLLTDVVVMALQCGRTRIACLGLVSASHSFSSEVAGPAWHDEVAHPAESDAIAQQRMVASKVAFFKDVLIPFVSKLDNIPTGDGKTLLDKSMVVWAQEHGNLTHQTTSIPIVTFGSADGALRTGSYCDYRNLARKTKLYGAPGELSNESFGLVMNQFFGNVLQVMGVPRSAYQEPNHNGYGYRPRGDMMLGDTNNTLSTSNVYPEAIWSITGQMLPWLAP